VDFKFRIRHIGYYDAQDGKGLRVAAEYLTERLKQLMPSAPANVWFKDIVKVESGGSGIIIGNGDLESNGKRDFETGEVSGIEVYQNVIYGARICNISVWNYWRWKLNKKEGWKMDNIRIHNNVVYQGGQGLNPAIGAITVDISMTNSWVKNNIIVGSGKAGLKVWGLAALKDEKQREAFFANNVVISHNLFHENVSDGRLGMNAVKNDPRFVLLPASLGASGNFQLQKDSPAIDAGIDMGLPKSGKAPDIGAYEYGLPAWSAGLEDEKPSSQK
jgi:hypothetical protein